MTKQLSQEENRPKPMGTIICPHCQQIQVGKCDLLCDKCGLPPWDAKELKQGVRALENMPCGHSKTEIISSDEGTSYCGACEREKNHEDII